MMSVCNVVVYATVRVRNNRAYNYECIFVFGVKEKKRISTNNNGNWRECKVDACLVLYEG